MKSLPLSSGTAVPLTLVIWILVLLDCLYHYTVREQSWLQSIPLAFVEGALCGVILWMCTRLDLARVTLCFLALPYLFFIPGWLNTPTALLLSVIFIFSLWRTLRITHSVKEHNITLQHLSAFILILLWVNVSGAGGYGYQTPDWSMHNARLRDLAELSWPIRYGENQNLVYYIGYFLPAAMAGKLTSLDIGLRSLFPWTVLGITLAIRWLSVLGQWRFSTGLVIVFALFGPLDLLNLLFLNLFSTTPLQEDITTLLGNSDHLDFRSRHDIGFFIGNYLSNTFQLYWSTQQVIAGWLCAGLLTYLYFTKNMAGFLFVYALLCLWAPFAMIALFPFVITAALIQLSDYYRSLLTFANIIGASALALVFVIFYTSGSTSNNLSFWIFDQMDTLKHYGVLLLLYLTSWGIYVCAITPYVLREEKIIQRWFLCLTFTLLVLPLYLFGDYADLLCRGSAPLMFLLLVFLLRALASHWQQGRIIHSCILACLLIIGTGSAYLQNQTSLAAYGKTRPVRSIIDYHNAFPNLGPDHSRFERWFRKKLP